MPEPLFDPNERIESDPSGGALPEGLKGKSAEEVARFYQQRLAAQERELVEARRQPAPRAPDPEKPKEISSSDIWSDPKTAVNEMIRQGAPSRAEFERASAFVQNNMIEVARMIMQQKHPDFPKYEREIMQLINKTEPWARADFNTWETAYTYVIGSKMEEIKAEAVARAQMGAEPPSPPAGTPPKPIELNAEQKYVIERMGITPEMYTKAIENMASGKFPLTMDNSRRGA